MPHNLMDEIPDKDERIDLGRGRGRDIALQPTYDGVTPTTRKDREAPTNGLDSLAVGGAWERNDHIRSMGATAIPFGNVGGSMQIGAGALRGVVVHPGVAADSPATVNVRSGSQFGTILASVRRSAAATNVLWFGDFGINFDGLYVEVVADTPANNRISGTVLVASVE